MFVMISLLEKIGYNFDGRRGNSLYLSRGEEEIRLFKNNGRCVVCKDGQKIKAIITGIEALELVKSL